MALTGLGCGTVPPSGGTVDDGSLCFERRGEPWLWTWSSAGLQSSTSEFSPLASLDPMHVGAWRFEVQAEGWYRMDAHIETADPSPSIYRVESAAEASEISVDAEAGWQELGAFYFEPGTSYEVTKGVLPSEAGAWLGFDAIRLTPAQDQGAAAGGCGCSTNSQSPGGPNLPAILLALGGLLSRRRPSRRSWGGQPPRNQRARNLVNEPRLRKLQQRPLSEPNYRNYKNCSSVPCPMEATR